MILFKGLCKTGDLGEMSTCLLLNFDFNFYFKTKHTFSISLYIRHLLGSLKSSVK